MILETLLLTATFIATTLTVLIIISNQESETFLGWGIILAGWSLPAAIAVLYLMRSV